VTQRSVKSLRHRDFYRDLEKLLTQIDQAQGFEEMLSDLLEKVIKSYAEYIGLESARLYRDEGDAYVVLRSFGAKGTQVVGFRVDRGYEVLRQLPPHQTRYFAPDDPALNPELEKALGVRHFAAFLVGPARDYIVAFGLSEDADVQEAMLILSTLRHAIDTRLRRSELEGQLQEAHSIQTSLFPGRSFTFDGYEIAGQSLPADQVGGDMLDYLPISANLLGLAVGDASGHGLPAALQARDVITGLRMGVEKDLKITAVCERLNRVIHRSGLTSRFVSLFFGELELNGNFVYVNAGHDPALLLRKGKRGQLLKSTGLVLGPVKDLEYRRGLVNIEPGDMLALYTDGIVERQGPDGEYGLARLRSLLQSRLDEDRPVLEILDEVFEDVRSFGQGQAWADDVTLMLVRRKPLADK